MRLLLATDHYLPHQGGSSRMILETSRRLQAHGHTVTIMTFERDLSLPQNDIVAGVPVRRVPLTGRLSTYPRALWAGWRAIGDELRRAPYDLLHIHLPLIGPGALAANREARLPCVASFYGPWHEEMAAELTARPLAALKGSLYRAYLRPLCWGLRRWQGQVLGRCRRVIVLSEYSQCQVRAFWPRVAAERIVTIPGGVDLNRFHPVPDRAVIRSRLGLPGDRMILFTVRRLVPRMGLENLLYAFARLSADRPELLLMIGGRGPLQSGLSALADRLGIAARARFAGFIAEEDLPAYYQAADLFVLPTAALEGFGLITVEALASGLPVVGTPIGSTAEVLGVFDSRFLTSGNDAVALEEGIRRGLVMLQSEGLALTERCRAFAVAHYDWERVVDRYEALYTEVAHVAR